MRAMWRARMVAVGALAIGVLACGAFDVGAVGAGAPIGSTHVQGADALSPTGAPAPKKLLVAHRGASAYAPEHTLAAYTLALAQGADYVEQDLALTKDGVLICLHDETLERTTDVEERFPDRFTGVTAQGTTMKRWYAADFTLAEIKTLDAGAWLDAKFAGTRVATFQEAIDLVRGKAGIFPELKSPALYKGRGVAMEPLVAEALKKNGFGSPGATATVTLQSFDADSLRAMARLVPEVPRVLLIEPFSADRLIGSADAVKALASFVTGIGPHKTILERRPDVVAWAHQAGLTVTPWTFRAATPSRFATVKEEMSYFLYDLGVDALFTDNPDQFPRAPVHP